MTIVIEREKIAIDLINWRGKPASHLIQDLASFPIESANLPPQERTNVVCLPLSDFEKLKNPFSKNPEDQATLRICQWAEKTIPEIEIFGPENEKGVFQSMEKFIDQNPGQILLWFSPSQENVYSESRIGLYQIILVNGEKYLFFRSLCGDYDFQDCLNLIKKLKQELVSEKFLFEIKSPEQLRASPIIIDVPGKSLFAFLGNVFSETPLVWEAIKKGQDIKRKIKATQVATTLLSPERISEIQQAISFEQQIIIGTQIEKDLQALLGVSLKTGSCGLLYSKLTNPFSFLPVFFGSPVEGRTRRHCGKCGKTGTFMRGETCPYDQSSQN